MSLIFRYLFVWLIFLTTIQLTYAQCPTCTPISPPTSGLDDDDLYIGDVKDGTQGEYYEDLLTFRMPQTTQPICDDYPGFIPGAFCGLSIGQVEIVDVVGLPQGVTYTTNQPDGIYDLPDEKDGCATICGTPLFPGNYTVTIIVKATVLGISQTTSFDQDMFIKPRVSSTEGFTVNPAAGCEDLTVQFTNNIPSNSNPGITYSWDFGNGLNSSAENPPTQLYTEPGAYIVTYEAVIDTVPLQLALVKISESGCNDDFTFITGAPDFFIKIFDQNGDEVYSTESTPVEDQYPPVEISIDTSLDLSSGNYTLEVWDKDPAALNQDDFCGRVNFDQDTDGSLIDGELTVDLTINDFTEIIISTDTIEVYQGPPEPIISGETLFCPNETLTLTSSAATGNQWYLNSDIITDATASTYDATEPGEYYVIVTTPSNCTATSNPITLAHDVPMTPVITGETLFCSGGNIILTSNSTTNNQWYFNSNPIPNATASTYGATEPGEYYVTSTSSTGCEVESPSVTLSYDVPTMPVINVSDNETEVCPNESITLASSVATGNQWYLNDALIQGATGQNYEADTAGIYALTVTSPTGCPSESATITLQECTTSVQDIEAINNSLSVYPNPNDGRFTLHFEVEQNKDLYIAVVDVTGRIIYDEILNRFAGIYHKNIELNTTSSGLYFIKIQIENNTIHKKVIVRL